MKKKFIALVCALALAVGLVGCSLSTPDSVGTIGEVGITIPLMIAGSIKRRNEKRKLPDEHIMVG